MEKDSSKKILVIGDAMLDRYSFGDVGRISPEAPIPVFKEKGEERMSPGGAANVAVNLAAIGVGTYLCAVTGADDDGNNLKRLLCDLKVDTSLIFEDDTRVTTRKLRYMGPNNQQMLRVDSEDDSDLPKNAQDAIFKMISDKISHFDLVLISDYAKGLLTDDLTGRVIKLANEKMIPVFVDVKGSNPDKYKGATLIKPNRKELAELSGRSADTTEEAVEAARFLCTYVGCKYVLATLGAEGMLLVNKTGLISQIKSVANEVFDVTGAGDTSVAYLAAEYAMGSTIEEAMNIANIAAGIQVSRVGTSVIDPHDVFMAAVKMSDNPQGSVSDAEHMLSDIEDCKKRGRKIVFTNGCFDIIHAGHVSYLKAAKRLGDILVVGLNDDDSVRRLKGNGRPINPLEDRIMVLNAIDSVDFVIPFSEDTPLELIKRITPDILVKGGDYKPDEIVGADHVKKNGGMVEVLPFLVGRSTTETIAKINNSGN